MTRIVIIGTNSTISATAFRDAGRGLAPLGGRASRRIEGKEADEPEFTNGMPNSIGGGHPQTLAADLAEIALLIAVFVAIPLAGLVW